MIHHEYGLRNSRVRESMITDCATPACMNENRHTPHQSCLSAFRADPGHTVMGELTLFGAAANTAGFEAAIHMVRGAQRRADRSGPALSCRSDHQSPDARRCFCSATSGHETSITAG